jgi:hypothetical protein
VYAWVSIGILLSRIKFLRKAHEESEQIFVLCLKHDRFATNCWMHAVDRPTLTSCTVIFFFLSVERTILSLYPQMHEKREKIPQTFQQHFERLEPQNE